MKTLDEYMALLVLTLPERQSSISGLKLFLKILLFILDSLQSSASKRQIPLF